jgi:hypothetical protein
MKVTLYPERYINGVVAHQPEVMREVDTVADAIGAIAKLRLEAHRREGNSYIEVLHEIPGKYGDIDALVTLVDKDTTRPDGSKSPGDAKAIEFGHYSNWTGKWVDGLYIVTGAAGLA